MESVLFGGARFTRGPFLYYQYLTHARFMATPFAVGVAGAVQRRTDALTLPCQPTPDANRTANTRESCNTVNVHAGHRATSVSRTE